MTRKHYKPIDVYTFKAEDDWGDYKNGVYRTSKPNREGYVSHRYVCTDGVSHKITEHIAKWEYFNGSIPDGMQIDHIIPLSSNGTNKLSNLRLVTPKENSNNPITLENASKARIGKKHSVEWNKHIGDSNRGKKRSEEIKKIISEHMTERLKNQENHPMYGRKGKNNPLFGRKLSDEHRKKISESHKGFNKGKSNLKLSVEICQCTLDLQLVKVWRSMAECNRNGFSSTAICKCCKKEYNKSGNNVYKGYRWYYKNDYEKMLAEQPC